MTAFLKVKNSVTGVVKFQMSWALTIKGTLQQELYPTKAKVSHVVGGVI